MFKRLQLQVAALFVALFAVGSAQAVSIVDYTSIMTQVTTELALGITAAVVGIGIIWGARIGVRFVKSLLT